MEREVCVMNQLGLHARPAAEFVRAARKFQCDVTLCKGGETYSATSILDVLTANLDRGAMFVLQAEGPDAEQAIAELCELLHEFKRQEEAG